jgi:hypothetical protein
MFARFRRCFTREEDDQLRDLVAQFGSNAWSAIAGFMPGRTPRQCRDHWAHYLSRPTHEVPWTAAEDAMLLAKVDEFGLKWTRLATFFLNHTDLDVKRRWFWICRTQREMLIKHAYRTVRSTRRSPRPIESSDSTEVTGDQSAVIPPKVEALEMSDYFWPKDEEDNGRASWNSLDEDFVGAWTS